MYNLQIPQSQTVSKPTHDILWKRHRTQTEPTHL